MKVTSVDTKSTLLSSDESFFCNQRHLAAEAGEKVGLEKVVEGAGKAESNYGPLSILRCGNTGRKRGWMRTQDEEGKAKEEDEIPAEPIFLPHSQRNPCSTALFSSRHCTYLHIWLHMFVTSRLKCGRGGEGGWGARALLINTKRGVGGGRGGAADWVPAIARCCRGRNTCSKEGGP